MRRPLASTTFAVDEELWFGEGTDVEAESRAAASLAAVGARIVGAKPFPIAARRLDELTRSTNTRIEQVVSVLESDPALSARLLRLVNSAGYGLKIRCTSVRHAAVLVGSRRLNQVATTAAILDLFDANNQRAVELLEHAAIVGSLCRYLAVHVGLPHDELFTCGFLHDIGKLMLLDAERERYADVLTEFGGAPDQIHIEERRVFGFDHAVLGAHVLAAWNIPDPVPKVIAWHHSPARAMQDTVLSSMVQTLRLADLLAYVLALHDEKVGIEIVSASDSARYLDISDAQLSAMWQDLFALRDRSRARSHGEPELDAIVPKSELPDSAIPSSRVSRASLSSNSIYRAARPLQEVPAHFPCNVCGKPSYGNVCPACGGHVCPDHQGTSDEWCSTCRREFGHFRKREELPLAIKIAIGALVGGTLAIGAVRAAKSPDDGWIAMLVVIALWAVVLPVAYKLWQKLAFLQTRRHSMPGSGLSISRPSTVAVVSAPPAQLADDALGDLDAPVPSDAPAVSIGPISTASLAMSVAPRSSTPLSVTPPGPEPSSSGRFPSGSHAPTQRSIESHPPLAREYSAVPRYSGLSPESVLPQSLLPNHSAVPQPSVMLVTSDALLSVAPVYTGPLVPDAPSVAPTLSSGASEMPARQPTVTEMPARQPTATEMPAVQTLVSEAPAAPLVASQVPAVTPLVSAPPVVAVAPRPSEGPEISVHASAPLEPVYVPSIPVLAPIASVPAPAPSVSVPAPAPVASVAPAPVASVAPATPAVGETPAISIQESASVEPMRVPSIPAAEPVAAPEPVAPVAAPALLASESAAAAAAPSLAGSKPSVPVSPVPPMASRSPSNEDGLGGTPAHTFTTAFVEGGAGGGGAGGADIGTAQESSAVMRISDVPESAVIATSDATSNARPVGAADSTESAGSNPTGDGVEPASQSNARVVFSLRPAPSPQANTAVAPDRTIRCAPATLNACAPVSVSTVDPVSPKAQRTAYGS